MAKRKKSRKSNGARRHRKMAASHRNPTRSTHRKRSGRRRHNPSMLSGTGSILKSGFYALIGLVLARQLPQMVLGTSNTGIIGYASNLAATILAAMVGGRFLGKEAGRDLAIGGGVYLASRVLGDNFAPVGKVLSLSGLGDYNALGDITTGYYPLPVPTNAAGQPIIPQEIRPVLPAPAPAGKGMGTIANSSRFISRF